jgi:hypothetical protein
MIMKLNHIFIGLLILPFSGYGQFNQEVLKDKPYKAGEKLIYTVKFGPIVGGTASIYIKQTHFNNIPVYHSVAEGKTVGVAEKLYSVKDVFESYFDINTGLPHKLVRDVKEGNYKKHEEAWFNRKNNTAYSLRKDTTIQVPSEIMDMVSLIYFIRSVNYNHLKPGDVIKTITYFDDEIFPFEIRYKGKEDVKTKYGKIRCHRFDPVVEPGRMFESEDDMQIWMSDDKNVIPVKVRFDLLVGSLRMELEQFANLKYPIVFTQD